MYNKSIKIVVFAALIALVGIFSVQSTFAAPKNTQKSLSQKSAKKTAVKKKQDVATKKASAKKTKSKTASKKASKTSAPKKNLALKTSNKKANASKKAKSTRAGKKSLAVNDPDLWRETEHLVVQSSAALVVDQNDGDMLYQKNARVSVPIASITKLMTAMVVLDGNLQMSQPVTITDDDVDYVRKSRSRLHVGSVMTRETALLLALMSSENRAANSLARHYPGGKRAFIQAMNAKAKSLGMTGTRFEDPTGLSSSNVSTAVDLGKMVQAAYQYPQIREFSTVPEAFVDIGGSELAYHNTNPLVKSASWNVGLSKTGFIHEAGKCLVMQARVANRPVVIVLLDSNGKTARVQDANRIKRWMESTLARNAAGEKVS